MNHTHWLLIVTIIIIGLLLFKTKLFENYSLLPYNTNMSNLNWYNAHTPVLDYDINQTQLSYLQMIDHFKKLSDGPRRRLRGECSYDKFITTTLDEILKININYLTTLVLSRINYSSKFKYTLIEYNSVKVLTDRFGNKQYTLDLFVEEPYNFFGGRLLIDVIAYIIPSPKKQSEQTCAQVTTPAFPETNIGYPSFEQMIPLPTQVIVTGKDVLSDKGINTKTPENIFGLYLNSARVLNSDLTLGSNNLNNLKRRIPGVSDTTIESSDYTGSSTPYIEKAVLRNKWPTLDSQPKDRKAWPCTPVPQEWNDLGLYPKVHPTKNCPGIRWSTTQQPLTPEWWYASIGVPRNSGQYYWLFDLARGVPANAANYNT
jgi:hypothetical protein